MKQGDEFQIHCYKHNQSLYRVWCNTTILEAHDDVLITVNDETKVVEIDGRTWQTREPAIYFFYKKNWFNIMAMLKPDGIHYYCNLSSPYVVDGEAIKYIDYDLDVKVFPDFLYTVLDREEYEIHREKMGYSYELQAIIDNQLNELINMINMRVRPFDYDYIRKLYDKYKEK